MANFGRALSVLMYLLLVHRCYSMRSSTWFKLVISGHRLTDNVIRELSTLSLLECTLHCMRKPSECKSINYRVKQRQDYSINCQLINATKTTHPQNLLEDRNYDNHEPIITTEFNGSSLPKFLNSSKIKVRKSCADWLNEGAATNTTLQDGVYSINPDGQKNTSFTVWCDMHTDGGGWTVFQKRKDGLQNFNRRWSSYENGFGESDSDYWLGLHRIYSMMKDQSQILRVDIQNWGNNSRYAVYGVFSIGSKDVEYKIKIGNYSGDAGDSLDYHNNRKFSTYDNDNDDDDVYGRNCAAVFQGGWWFRDCLECNLNGRYIQGGNHSFARGTGVQWQKFTGEQYSLKYTEMKMRPKN